MPREKDTSLGLPSSPCLRRADAASHPCPMRTGRWLWVTQNLELRTASSDARSKRPPFTGRRRDSNLCPTGRCTRCPVRHRMATARGTHPSKPRRRADPTGNEEPSQRGGISRKANVNQKRDKQESEDGRDQCSDGWRQLARNPVEPSRLRIPSVTDPRSLGDTDLIALGQAMKATVQFGPGELALNASQQPIPVLGLERQSAVHCCPNRGDEPSKRGRPHRQDILERRRCPQDDVCSDSK